jgi:hypothetical protein
MAVVDYTLTLTGSAQALSTATSASAATVRTVTIQQDPANTHVAYVGASSALTSAAWGVRLPAPVAGEPAAPFMLGDTQSQHGHFKLSDVYVLGTAAEKLHLLVVTI